MIKLKQVISIAFKSIGVTFLVQFSIGVILALAWAKPDYRFIDQFQMLIYILILALGKAYPVILALYFLSGFIFRVFINKSPILWFYVLFLALYLFAMFFMFVGFHDFTFTFNGCEYLISKLLSREKSNIYLVSASCVGYLYFLIRLGQHA